MRPSSTLIDPQAARRHARAVILMLCVATLWSSAGVITRQLERAASFEVTFWRSLFAALGIGVYLLVTRREVVAPLWRAGWTGLASGCMWATMFTCFMVALTMTTVANTLVVLSTAPVLTALLAWLVLRERVAAPTWLAIAVATAGLAWMFGAGVQGGHLAGMLVAFGAPLAASINFIITRKVGARIDLVPAVLTGGVLSALVTLPWAGSAILAGSVSPHDLGWLAALGLFQLALPCALMIHAARHLSAPEMSLLALLEVILGPLWAWLGAGEVPAASTLGGGAVVLSALVFNELALARRRGGFRA